MLLLAVLSCQDNIEDDVLLKQKEEVVKVEGKSSEDCGCDISINPLISQEVLPAEIQCWNRYIGYPFNLYTLPGDADFFTMNGYTIDIIQDYVNVTELPCGLAKLVQKCSPTGSAWIVTKSVCAN
ncbi:hypothetical protein [Tenacibaculum mesophilum]|uniref:hypothetical protein n=1 Tax=Tenacibaculum mesophilum TaxID=104268 RepID=UPI001160D5EE|nr:hypothetical protein [Tenacibaculum mesophilum]